MTRQPFTTASSRRLVSVLVPADLIDFFVDHCDEKG